MSLYTPAHFATSDRAAVARLMHDHAFATLVTPGTPEPLVSHLPLLFVPGCEPHGTLIGHFARANPHEDRGRVVAGLRTDGYAEALNTAAWMEIYTDASKDAP